MTKEDVEVNLSVIQGTLFILDTPVHALIDPGSTYSFISHALARNLRGETESMGCLMVILTPMGRSMKSMKMVRGCEVSLSNVRFQAYLILLEVYDFDILLGMDFLSNYDANIDYRRKIMTIRKPEGKWVKFRGQGNLKIRKVISAIKVIKMMS